MAAKDHLSPHQFTTSLGEGGRCTETVLKAFGIHGKAPHSGGGVLEHLTNGGYHYRAMDEPEYKGTVRKFAHTHGGQGKDYYLVTAQGAHGMALRDKHLTDYEGRGLDRRQVHGAYEVSKEPFPSEPPHVVRLGHENGS